MIAAQEIVLGSTADEITIKYLGSLFIFVPCSYASMHLNLIPIYPFQP